MTLFLFRRRNAPSSNFSTKSRSAKLSPGGCPHGGVSEPEPRRLQGLLTDCQSVKVKCLFFWFADRHNRAWLPKINRAVIDLGKGKRMLVRGRPARPEIQ